jgi:glyoxalase family protein
MELSGLHHVTAITGDAQRCVDFYVTVLGLRFTKKTVNHDAPEVYHLYFSDYEGTPGSVLTFFEYPGASSGRSGAGMVSRIDWRVPGDSLDFWEERLNKLATGGMERDGDRISFEDPEGLGLGLVADHGDVAPLVAPSDDIPKGSELRGFDGVEATSVDVESTKGILTDVLGFKGDGSTYEVSDGSRSSSYILGTSNVLGVPAAGTVHHVAWGCEPSEHETWRNHIASSGLNVTPVIDRIYFRSIYFREPGGVLFEIATRGPGFTVDEPLEELGTKLVLPSRYEGMRSELERALTPIRVP